MNVTARDAPLTVELTGAISSVTMGSFSSSGGIGAICPDDRRHRFVHHLRAFHVRPLEVVLR